MSPRASDVIRLPDGRIYVWEGTWPPPERLGVATGRLTGSLCIFDPAALPAGVDLAAVEGVAVVEYVVRESYSKLPDGLDSARVARAAAYREETP